MKLLILSLALTFFISLTAGASCLPGFTLCGENCVNLDVSIDHCGKCFNNCGAPGQVCVRAEGVIQAQCTCPSGMQVCTKGGLPFCADVKIDPTNCGGCGNVVLPTQYCSDGKAVLETACAGGKVLCGSPKQCVETAQCIDNKYVTMSVAKSASFNVQIQPSTITVVGNTAKASHLLTAQQDSFFIRGLPSFSPTSALEEVSYTLKVIGLANGAKIKVHICQDYITRESCEINAIAPAKELLLDSFNNRVEVRSKKGLEFHVVIEVIGYDSSKAYQKRDVEQSSSTFTLEHATGIVQAREAIIIVNTNMRNIVSIA